MLSLICLESDCTNGEALVNEMDSTFQALPANLQLQFQSAHDSIMTSFNSYWVSIDKWIPFNPICCSILTLGQQANQLTIQMQQALGQTSVGVPTGSTFDLSSLLGGSGTLLAFGVVAFLLLSEVNRAR